MGLNAALECKLVLHSDVILDTVLSALLLSAAAFDVHYAVA